MYGFVFQFALFHMYIVSYNRATLVKNKTQNFLLACMRLLCFAFFEPGSLQYTGTLPSMQVSKYVMENSKIKRTKKKEGVYLKVTIYKYV